MGCLMVGVAAALALAMPAAVAPASLVGAYLLIALFAVLAVVAITRRSGRTPQSDPVGPRRHSVAMVRVGALALAYAVVVSVIHVAA